MTGLAIAPTPGLTSNVPLRWRILAVNVFAIALLAGGLFYLDSYRSRLVERERSDLASDAQLLGSLTGLSLTAQEHEAVLQYARSNRARVRIYASAGQKIFDSFVAASPTYELQDPSQQKWQRHVARALDSAIDWLVQTPSPAVFREPRSDILSAWPELRSAVHSGQTVTTYRFAPDRTPLLTAARPLANGDGAILISTNARWITSTVRAERLDWLLVLAATLIISVLLSRFLARTIVEPLRMLAKAALRVRLGRARDVVVPRLPERRDEIGQLARAVSDMTAALRERIDAGEQFAADVAHELKNPLASLRSALETLEMVEDRSLQHQLMAIAREDVHRLDRLITDISDASRLDAQLSRTQFEPVDIGELVETLITARKLRAMQSGPDIAFARPQIGTTIVAGVRSQLARVLENLLDNAVSFSPTDGIIKISASCANQRVFVRVEDEGPGIPPEQREEIFRRFHSLRSGKAAAFGKHSGLGLAIARTIVEAHNGIISTVDREDGLQGASFIITLPRYEVAH